MFVQVFNQFAELMPYQHRWDELAGDCPFRSWSWLSTWWKHFGERCELYAVLAFDGAATCGNEATFRGNPVAPADLVGVLPAYVESSHTRGRVLRLLGDGEVCSEHLDLLCDEDRVAEVSKCVAQYLVAQSEEWDSIKFTTVHEADRNLRTLVHWLGKLDCIVEMSAGMNLWSIPLPATWEEFLAMQSKSHRKQLRQLKSRVLAGPRVRWIEVRDHAAFDTAWEILIDLHQRRRQSLGEPGCFASPQWANFHREVALELLSAGNLRLSVLQVDDRPIAAEYHLSDRAATYAYQGGIDPDRAADEPGQLSLILCIERAIAAGHHRFELLRGDEPYKPHWRALPTTTVDIEIISPRTLAQWRHYSWSSLRRAGRLARQFASLLS